MGDREADKGTGFRLDTDQGSGVVAAAAQGGNLKDSDLAVGAFRMINAGMRGRRWVEKIAGSKPDPPEEEAPRSALFRRGDGGVLVVWGKLVQRGKRQTSFTTEKKKTGNLRTDTLG